jgi:hypothetical protein
MTAPEIKEQVLDSARSFQHDSLTLSKEKQE